MEVTQKMIDLASEAYENFEIGTRESGTRYSALREGAPEWAQAMVREVHSDMFPDDFVYYVIEDACAAIAETEDGEDTDDIINDFSDSGVDVYTNRLVDWMTSSLVRPGRVNDEIAAMSSNGECVTLEVLIARAQYGERQEIFQSVVNYIESEADEC